jgi:hydrogenase maturation protein HypF
MMATMRVRVSGVVQGVGFRPFVYGLATRLELRGWVRNTSGGVEILVDGQNSQIKKFIHSLEIEAPPLARIDSIDTEIELSNIEYPNFDIQPSTQIEGAFQPISHDTAICSDCERELFDPTDRRYLYPFINCTNCGPRFTIITDIPYDRPNTTMANFPLCDDCRAEYENPLDRRFHAQPVACSKCGPFVTLRETRIRTPESDPMVSTILYRISAILKARRLLREGHILAIKGLGGFHLACDADNAYAVEELRRRKGRVGKPFALMAAELETIKEFCNISQEETKLLTGHEKPIVLLPKKQNSNYIGVAPNMNALGFMLPYTPLHHLLLNQTDPVLAREPAPTILVMTSGNFSEEPIATDNEEAFERLSPLADAFLIHNRDIHVRCDDSVVRVFEKEVYPIRRSRGYAPFPVKLPADVLPLLAAGSELKNTFCITSQNYAFLSHHIGDMENYETLKSFEDGIEHFERLFRVKPEAIAYDLHPDYLATRFALERAERENLPAIGVQHHHAHIAACMADNGLDGLEPVIGLSFDGTGFGEDGAIWGGEFLVADYKSYQRVLHLGYFPLPGGDAAIRKPARTALALLWGLGLHWDEGLASVVALNEKERSVLHAQLEGNINTPMTSSMGRLFDAAASLAGVRQNVNYEGQAAIEFEALADPAEAGRYSFEVEQDQVGVRGVFEELLRDVSSGVPVPRISACFHNGLAEGVRTAVNQISRDTGIRSVALSGGVWQNITLLGRTLSLLQNDGFKVYLHHKVPANDGGLSLGQAVIAASRLRG